MQPELKKGSLLLGFALFLLCFIGVLFETGPFVVIVSHFLPGFAYSLLLLHYSEYNETISNKFFFIVLSSVIYIVCVLFIDLNSDVRIITSIKMIIAASLGAVLLKACYDHFFARNLKTNSTFILPMIGGALASLPSAICLYFLNNTGIEDSLIQMLLYTGIFSIFPLWLYLFSIQVVRTDHGD